MKRNIGSFGKNRAFCMAAAVIALAVMCGLWGCSGKEKDAAGAADAAQSVAQESSSLQADSRHAAVTIRQGSEQIELRELLVSAKTYSKEMKGWVVGDGAGLSRMAEETAEDLPRILWGQDFEIQIPKSQRFYYMDVLDGDYDEVLRAYPDSEEESQESAAETCLENLEVLSCGTYYVSVAVVEEGNYIEFQGENETAVYEYAFCLEKSLPFYRYTGENDYIKGVCDYFCGLANGNEERMKLQKELASSEGKGGDIVYIPVPVIMKTEESEGKVYLYGTFWDMWYVLDGTNLYSLSGGENTGRLELSETNGEFRVTGFERIRDGGDYVEDWKRLCGEDQTLYDRLFTKEEREDRRDIIRGEMILQYAQDHGLDIRSYQDYGWEPVKLPGIAGVEMKVRKDSITPMSLSLTISNDTDLNIQYGDDYYLEKWDGGAWIRVPYAEESYGFPSIAWNVPKGSPAEIDVDWSVLYGELEPGKYRIVKKILDFRGTGDYDAYDLYAEFTIEEQEAV